MKNFFKGKVATAIILLATLVLAGVAIFTAIRLYELRQTSVAPNVPSSLPKAADITPPADQTKACNLSFSITLASGSPTPTPTPTPTAPPGSSPTPTPTVTPTPTSPPGAPNNCNGTCGSNANCSAGYMCYQGFCRNASCVTSTNCVCPGTPAPTATPAALPQSGTDWPSVLGIGIGILTIIGSLILAL